MKTIINGEAPFQVLTQNFSIGPADAYTLQISADGVNYSDLFSVGADVTRMVSDVAAGSFYRLAGNGRDGVVINWMKSCGEGGGSGEAGVASLNGQKGNLTLKTINGNDLLGGGNIEIEGGSSDILKARTSFPTDASNGDVVAAVLPAKTSITGQDFNEEGAVAYIDYADNTSIRIECQGDDGTEVIIRDGELTTDGWVIVGGCFIEDGVYYWGWDANDYIIKVERDGQYFKITRGNNGESIKFVSDVFTIKETNGVYQFAGAKDIKWFQFNLALDYFRAQMDSEGVNSWTFYVAKTNEFALSTDGWSWNLGPDKNSKTWVLGNEVGSEYVHLYDNVKVKMGDDALILDVISEDWQSIEPYNEAIENVTEITESVDEWKPVGSGEGGGVQSAEISKIKVLTQDEYEALGDDKDMTTLYIIKG